MNLCVAGKRERRESREHEKVRKMENQGGKREKEIVRGKGANSPRFEPGPL